MLTTEQQDKAKQFFQDLQAKLVKALEGVDGNARAESKEWQRPEGGGGRMCTLRGDVVEKAGANFSEVYGEKYPAIEGEHKDKPFWAAGVSTITHMMNPHAPIGHMNLRLICIDQQDFWFGGGGDLTPFKIYHEDTKLFHANLKKACDLYSSASYEKFAKWCEEYFYIKHRKSPRGVGGVFFDYVKGDFEVVFPFIQSIGLAYLEAYIQIIRRRKDMQYKESEKIQQEYWRGRYVEFNLLYDRGTRFGLMTGGNVEAIFVSLPPRVRW